MARIIFTDAIGTAVLHNGKPAPANRFSNWKPNPMPIGEKANRQSDGALTMFRYRDDFGATFDLTGIPVAASPQNLLEPNGDITGTVGATPTGMGTSTMAPTVALARSSGAPGDYGYNGLIAKHVLGAVSGTFNDMAIVGINTHVYQFIVAVYIPSGSTATDVFTDIENTVAGSTTAHADLTKTSQWQLLTVTATATGTDIHPTLRMSGPSGAVCYSDLWQLNDLTAGTVVRPVDIADRLVYWLENGGTCEVDTGDYDGNIYATCGLYPGSSTQPPALSDRKNLEYTLHLDLVNLAGSPVRMRCHYGGI